MTFKGTSDKENWQNRTGSHATRPLSNGRIVDLPDWAKKPEEYYNSVRERYEILSKQHFDANQRVAEINRRLKNPLPFAEFKRLSTELDHLSPLSKSLEREAAEYRTLARAAATNAFGAVFFYCAQRVMDGKAFRELEQQAMEIIARSPTDGIGKTESEKNPTRNLRTNSKNKQRRFAIARERNNTDVDHRLVFSSAKTISLPRVR